MTKAKKPHEFVLYETEGRGFQHPVNSTEFLNPVANFLDAHNPASAPQAPIEGQVMSRH